MLRSASPRWVVIGLAVVSAAVFVGHEVAIQAAFRGTLSSAGEITDNAMPSVRTLASLRHALSSLRTEALQMRVDPTSVKAERLSGALGALQADAASYLALPRFPGELEGQRALEDSLGRLRQAVAGMCAATTQADVRDAHIRAFVPAVDEADRIAETLVELNARNASRATGTIASLHASAMHLSLAFLFASLAIVAVVAVGADRLIRADERETERRMSELDAFASRVAHDLRSPLSPVVLATALLAREESLSDRGRIALERAATGLRNALALIDGLLAYARAGSRPDPNARASVAAVARDVAGELESLAQAERGRISVEVPPDLDAAASEPVLHCILGNLVRNGLLYLGDSGDRSVTIRAHPAGTAAVIEVLDHGAGMSRELLSRIFEPFERGSERPGGHGLGLATVKRLVEGHGGEVRVRSDPGAGTVFAVVLPRAKARALVLEEQPVE